MAAANDVVVTTGGPAIVILSALVAEAPTLSPTRIVKLDVPAVDGVPLMTPVEAVMLSPEGREPPVIDHENGATPPEFVAVVE